MAVAGGVAAGYQTVPAETTELTGNEHAEIEAFVARAHLPQAPLATIAVCRVAELPDMAVALALVSALRRRRDARGCRPTVVITVDASAAGSARFVQELLGQGAFVIRAGHGMSGDHLHHYPLRAAIEPPGGRLVCVDLADHLAI